MTDVELYEAGAKMIDAAAEWPIALIVQLLTAREIEALDLTPPPTVDA